ncbi:glycosyltransferase family 2 protein [Pedobacter sp. PAMC26386]|nr:glycosyltransferase family 2 protein [Pedobacter sp. PAMC26386]
MHKSVFPGVSLIVSTYNWPEALNLCLLSISKQQVLPDEVIIADDGSAEETKNLIAQYQQSFPIPLIHVWQEDNGFQLSKIRNKAMAKASREYIVQIDGDLILEKSFIREHLEFRLHRTFVSGTRVNMSAELSEKLINKSSIAVNVFSKGITNFLNGLKIPPLTSFLAKKYKAGNLSYVRGCNMAFWKADLLKVNGYNEEIVGWGREDSELAIRLMNAGISKRIIKFAAVTFHIYHSETPRVRLSVNDEILNDTLKSRIKKCKLGISQYLQD